MDRIIIIGRFEEEREGLSFSWPGTTIKGSFIGSNISIDIEVPEELYFSITIDGKVDRHKFSPKITNYRLASDLESVEHKFTITLCHEVRSKIYLKSVSTDGEFTTFDEDRLKIEFIGDSLTVGYGNMSPDISWDRKDCYTYYTDHTKGYAHLTAKHFNADAMITAFSGKGLLLNYNNDEPGINVPYYYDSIHPLKDSPKWEHGKYVPDITVINLGTNDFSNEIDLVQWEKVYVDFIERVRGNYKNTKIVLISPNGIAEEVIRNISKKYSCSFYKYNVEYSALDTHPNSSEHLEISKGLIKIISDLDLVF